MRSTFKVLFFLKRDKQKKDGSVPIYCRITIDGKEARFGMKKDIQPKLWDVKAGKASGRTLESSEINALLESAKSSIHKTYRDLLERESAVSAEKVKNTFLGLESKRHMFLEVFKDCVEEKRLLTGRKNAKSTYRRYLYVKKRMEEFLASEYHLTDIPLCEINYEFIRNFEMYLLTVRGNRQSTVAMYLINFKQIINLALKKEWIYRDPFINYKIQGKASDRGYLTQQEIEVLMNQKFDKKLEKTRDVFIFCCFTSLSYIDVLKLKKEDVSVLFDGKEWILGKREKTEVGYFIPLTEIPKMILEKYKNTPIRNGKSLPVKCNSLINEDIKKIAKICGINKHLTFHMSRHTFATLTLTKGVSLESVSRMMGHKNVQTTQIYARITSEKVGRDMKVFSENIKDIENKFAVAF